MNTTPKRFAKTWPVPPVMKKAVHQWMQECAWNLGVSQYLMNIHWMKEDKPGGDRDGNVLAEISVDRRYLHASISIYPCLVEHWHEGKEARDKIVRHTIFHEVAHILTQHLFDVGTATYRDEGEMKDAWETLTEACGRMAARITDLESKKK